MANRNPCLVVDFGNPITKVVLVLPVICGMLVRLKVTHRKIKKNYASMWSGLTKRGKTR